jgi:hypothetical protein
VRAPGERKGPGRVSGFKRFVAQGHFQVRAQLGRPRDRPGSITKKRASERKLASRASFLHSVLPGPRRTHAGTHDDCIQ